MSTAPAGTPQGAAPDVLDDYLEQLLGDVAASAAAEAALPAGADACAAPDAVAADQPAAQADEADAAPAQAEREPSWDDLPDEVIYETGGGVTTDTDNPALQAAFDAAIEAEASEPAAAEAAPDPAAAVEREPTWDDLPDEIVYETAANANADSDDAALQAAFDAVASSAPTTAPAAAMPEPTWDDLPDEVIYETGAGESTTLTNADSPALEAAFSAAAAPDAPAATVSAAPAAARAAPAARAPAPMPTPPPAPRRPAPAPAAPSAAAPAQPTTWQELQAQAHRDDHGLHPHRRATERSSRWLRLRCGSQAYALELLKVQEVVLPVPLLPLRGTATAMLGIMNLRGQVVPVMDLGIHLGGKPADEDALTRIVVLEENGEIMGLRVSAVEDVTNLTESQIEPPDTARICRISNDVFRGVARLHQQPMILLDATRLLG